MAISEITKRIVLGKKNELQAQIDSLVKEKEGHQASIDAINVQLTELRAQKQALTADIADPTPEQVGP